MSKLSVMVDFPVHGLDLTNHLASRSQPSQLNSGAQGRVSYIDDVVTEQV